MYDIKNNNDDIRIYYLLLSGLTYSEIANKYYHRQKYKFVYQVRKILTRLGLKNRRQLAYYAVANHLINKNRTELYDEQSFL